MADLVFFYGTLMAGFDRRRRADIDSKLTFVGRGTIRAALFDLGLYPAAVPAPDGKVLGELYEAIDPDAVLPVLDEIEGYRPGASRPEPVYEGSHRGGAGRRASGCGLGVLLQRAAWPCLADRIGRLPRTRQTRFAPLGLRSGPSYSDAPGSIVDAGAALSDGADPSPVPAGFLSGCDFSFASALSSRTWVRGLLTGLRRKSTTPRVTISFTWYASFSPLSTITWSSWRLGVCRVQRYRIEVNVPICTLG